MSLTTPNHALSLESAEADYQLGLSLEYADPRAAWYAFQRAAEAGCAPAMTKLGQRLARAADWDRADRDGIPQPFDFIQPRPGFLTQAARDWFAAAAALGDIEAEFEIGLLLEPGRLDDALWLAAGAAGQDDLGLSVDWEPDAPVALSERQEEIGFYEKAAHGGHVPAMIKLAQVMWDEDRAQARSWIDQALTSGSTDAMGAYAELIGDSDPESAREWYRKAARGGAYRWTAQLALFVGEHWPEEASELAHDAFDAADGDEARITRLAVKFPHVAHERYACYAEAGDVPALRVLAHGFRWTNPEQARHWCDLLAGSPEVIPAAEALFAPVPIGDDDSDGIAWLEDKANAGSLPAAVHLARRFQFIDDEKSDRWFLALPRDVLAQALADDPQKLAALTSRP